MAMVFCRGCGKEIHETASTCPQCGAPQGTVAERSALQRELPSLPQSSNFAGFWLRTFAAVIDGVLMLIVLIVLAVFIAMTGVFANLMAGKSNAGDSSEPIAVALFGILAVLLGPWLWFTISESSQWQASIGKRMLGLKVTDENGARIGFGRANVRYWSKSFLSTMLMIGFVMVGLTEKKQGLHDMIARTLVVKKNA